MSTIVKDTEVLPVSPEVVTPRAAAGNLAAPEFVAKPQPVALEVSITVNGARSVDGTERVCMEATSPIGAPKRKKFSRLRVECGEEITDVFTHQ